MHRVAVLVLDEEERVPAADHQHCETDAFDTNDGRKQRRYDFFSSTSVRGIRPERQGRLFGIEEPLSTRVQLLRTCKTLVSSDKDLRVDVSMRSPEGVSVHELR